MNLVDQIKILYESRLFVDVKLATSIVLTMSEHNEELLTPTIKYQMLSFQGEALYETGEYRRAEVVLVKALQMRKMIHKVKGKTQALDIPTEVEVKYMLHLCYCLLQQHKEALSVLEGVSSKQRTAKINMALAKLYQRMGQDRSAVTAFKEVLRQCPMSLEAARGLMALGVKSAEVSALMMVCLPGGSTSEWLCTWIKGQGLAATREFVPATQTLRALDVKPMLRDNEDLLLSIGEACFQNGDYVEAQATLQRAHALDPLLLEKMDVLAFLLAREKKIKELESLALQMMSVSEDAAQPWVAMGYLCLDTKKVTRAVYFAQKAQRLDTTSLMAILLKGRALQKLNRLTDAGMYFREAIRLAPHQYEAYKGLVDCLQANRRNREAIAIAGQACKQVGMNPRCFTLYASVLAKEPLSLEKAKTYLERAVKMDGSHLDTVYLLADILLQQQQYDKGIELLKKLLEQQSTCRAHQMLGDFLSHTNQPQEALDQYSIAISIDPGNTRARHGMYRLEKRTDVGLDTTYDMDVDDASTSENEADVEGSDMESGWSDLDINPDA